VLLVLYISVFVAAIAAWLVILLTRRYPRGIFDFIEGVIRWHNRVIGHALILVTDAYPPGPTERLNPRHIINRQRVRPPEGSAPLTRSTCAAPPGGRGTPRSGARSSGRDPRLALHTVWMRAAR
jgi:hypothetical protein